MRPSEPRVFTIPPGCPFLPTLIDSIAAGEVVPGVTLEAPEWAHATIYVPTKRAARAFARLLAERGDGKAQLLPRILALGETGEAEFDLAEAGFEAAAALKPPIAPLERRLILTRLIQEWSERVDRAMLRLEPDVPFLVPTSPADAVALAGDLERLMDALTVENLPWDEIRDAVETDFSEYYKLTWDFVRIAAESWPVLLAERDASDPARRQAELIRAEARRLAADRAPGPVIAAGSTGSIPATAALLAAIAALPNGAVVLPGLDTDLDAEGWAAIPGVRTDSESVHGHPQALLHRLLTNGFGVERAAVRVLGAAPEAVAARTRVLSEALRPAETTDSWAEMARDQRARLAGLACDGLAIVEAMDEREEALAAAVALREALETPGRTAALVTPDRGLAARVAAELARWNIGVEDSAGVALSDTAAGRLARLAAEAAAFDFEPARVLALLAHPDVLLGLTRPEVERAAAALEIGVLRGPEPAPGLAGIAKALDAARTSPPGHAARAWRRLAGADWDAASDLLHRLTVAFEGFTAADVGRALPLVILGAAHRAVIERLRDGAPERDDPAAEALYELFDELTFAEADLVTGRFTDYPPFFNAIARERVLSRRPQAAHRRVKILGLLEARLLNVDRVVLGGLDEGIWPPRVDTDAFLNRPMRAKVGLSPPERRIGQTAHDFVQALGCRDAVITRAAKREGSPMVPSRFLQRLKAFAGEVVWNDAVQAGRHYRDLARVLDEAAPAPPLARPRPKPDPALFPRRLSVTEIETLVRDPYGIFAKHVLKLDALEPLSAPPGAADRGTIVHEILGKFAEAHPAALPADAAARLHQLGLDAFQKVAEAHPHLYAEWWPRFQRLATEYLLWEEERRREIADIAVERSGKIEIPLPGNGVFTLRARADRIERRHDGTYAVVDFKTGQPPGVREVFAGFSPQLTLEAAMLMRGAFGDVGTSAACPDLLYVHASGARPALKPRVIESPADETRTTAQLVDEHFAKLTGLVARFVAGEAAYLSRPYAKYAKRYSDYDHLARVKEWSAASADEGEA
jgi:ATP-dependent helicase/nuclease subunit B